MGIVFVIVHSGRPAVVPTSGRPSLKSSNCCRLRCHGEGEIYDATDEVLLLKRREKARSARGGRQGASLLFCEQRQNGLPHRPFKLGEQTEGGGRWADMDGRRRTACGVVGNDRARILRNSVHVVFSPHHRQRHRPTRRPCGRVASLGRRPAVWAAARCRSLGRPIQLHRRGSFDKMSQLS